MIGIFGLLKSVGKKVIKQEVDKKKAEKAREIIWVGRASGTILLAGGVSSLLTS